MSIIAAHSTDRYTATLDEFGTCEVSGFAALLILQRPDNTSDLDAQRELRDEIQNAFNHQVPGIDAGIIRWEAIL